jgi:hypothetical protein
MRSACNGLSNNFLSYILVSKEDRNGLYKYLIDILNPLSKFEDINEEFKST